VKKLRKQVELRDIRLAHAKNRAEILARLGEFALVHESGSDDKFWEEMVYCFFTGGCSARMGLRSIEAVRPLLRNGSFSELSQALSGVHRFPFARSRYIVETRAFLESHCTMRIRDSLFEVNDPIERRDWLVSEKRIKGLGYKEASHFLRNVGFRGYAILDKHVLQCMFELQLIDEPKPPSSRKRYLDVEQKLREFARKVRIDFDELDLVLWSLRTGEVLK